MAVTFHSCSNLTFYAANPFVPFFPTHLSNIHDNLLYSTHEFAMLKTEEFIFALEQKFAIAAIIDSPIHLGALVKILRMMNTEQNGIIRAAFQKQEGYLSRFFSHEGWEEWTQNRSALGRIALVFIDYALQPKKTVMNRIDLETARRANQEAEQVLQRLALQADTEESETIFKPSYLSAIGNRLSSLDARLGRLLGRLFTILPGVGATPTSSGDQKCANSGREQQCEGSDQFSERQPPDIGDKIVALTTTFNGKCTPSALLKNMGTPPQDMLWYKEAIHEMEETLFQDFMRGGYSGVLASLHMGNAALLMKWHADIYPEFLALRTESFKFYQNQISFNRKVEAEILDYLSEAQKSLAELYVLLPKIKEYNSNLFSTGDCNEVADAIINKENSRILKLHQNFVNSLADFLTKIEGLETSIGNTLKNMRTSNKDIVGVETIFRNISEKNKSLENVKKNAEAEKNRLLSKAQEAVEKESLSRKKEFVNSGRDYCFLGICFGSKASETKLYQADFGSKELYEEYLASKAKFDNDIKTINKEIDEQRKELRFALKNALVGSTNSLDNKNVEEACSAFSNALMFVDQLKEDIAAKKSDAEVQIDIIKKKLKARSGANNIDPDYYLGELYKIILFLHSKWKLSYTQSSMLEVIEKDEIRLWSEASMKNSNVISFMNDVINKIIRLCCINNPSDDLCKNSCR
ncbi:MAG TPA: hypothetical protein VHK67_01535 [Rhabdochlamydiaceae bacterium]|jgi:hypothetical protein|nr:hypothetical protein [Rhabdochlamydiaceae bacterium]